LYQMLNNSAKGLSGARGRRMAERSDIQKQLIITKALQEHVMTHQFNNNG